MKASKIFFLSCINFRLNLQATKVPLAQGALARNQYRSFIPSRDEGSAHKEHPLIPFFYRLATLLTQQDMDDDVNENKLK